MPLWRPFAHTSHLVGLLEGLSLCIACSSGPAEFPDLQSSVEGKFRSVMLRTIQRPGSALCLR